MDEQISTKTSHIPKFARKEVDTRAVIGSGGFSVVMEVYGMVLDEVYDTSDETAVERAGFAAEAAEKRTVHGHPAYVLKTLRQDLDEEEHTKGVVDLAIEAEFLASVKHAHILPIRGMAHGDWHADRFFVILDRLAITLDRKFDYWRKVVGDNAGVYVVGWGYCCAKTVALQALWKERHSVMRQIASAIHYLHTKGIMYRDLKPENVGFDDHDVVKIFDFGLAKQWKTAELADAHQQTYHLTGQTGSLRYMAPEVCMDMPYNESCDVYSWGILYWQVCSLQAPFSKYSTRQHAEKVVHGGERPKPDKSWPHPWKELMQECWQQMSGLRPTMEHVLEQVTSFSRSLASGIDDDDDERDVETGGIGSVSLTLSTTTDAGKIKAKKKKKTVADGNLDADTRQLGAGAGHYGTANLTNRQTGSADMV